VLLLDARSTIRTKEKLSKIKKMYKSRADDRE
jgi:hypothetical protein